MEDYDSGKEKGNEVRKEEKLLKENSTIKKERGRFSIFQNSLILCIILGIVSVGLVALGFTIIFHITYDFPDDEVLKLKYMNYYLGIYKTIFVSFLVTLLVALLPQVYTEKKDRFERLKESRLAYSEAKTAVIYLPYKLSEMNYLQGASALEVAHVKLGGHWGIGVKP